MAAGSSCHWAGVRWPRAPLIPITCLTSPYHDPDVRRARKSLVWVSRPVSGVLGGLDRRKQSQFVEENKCCFAAFGMH